MADKFTSADTNTLLSQPGYFYYRDFGSTGPWNKAVFANGATYTPAVETAEIAFDDVGTVREEIANETAEIALSSGRVLDFNFIHALTGGLYTKEVVAGTLVSGHVQTVASGAWAYDQVILLDKQNGDLSKQTIASVVGSVDGALVANTDYFMTFLPEVGWAIYIKDTATVTTLVQNIVVTYSYTPNAQTILKRGGVKIMQPIELAFQTVAEDGDYVQFLFYKCYTNGADGHGFSPENSSEPVTMDFTFTAKKDINRASGDQLFRKVKGDVSLG